MEFINHLLSCLYATDFWFMLSQRVGVQILCYYDYEKIVLFVISITQYYFDKILLKVIITRNLLYREKMAKDMHPRKTSAGIG